MQDVWNAVNVRFGAIRRQEVRVKAFAFMVHATVVGKVVIATRSCTAIVAKDSAGVVLVLFWHRVFLKHDLYSAVEGGHISNRFETEWTLVRSLDMVLVAGQVDRMAAGLFASSSVILCKKHVAEKKYHEDDRLTTFKEIITTDGAIGMQSALDTFVVTFECNRQADVACLAVEIVFI